MGNIVKQLDACTAHVIGVCGPAYNGPKPDHYITTRSMHKEAADYLLTVLLTDWHANGKLDGMKVFVVTKDHKLANIKDIFSELYGFTVNVTPFLPTAEELL